MRGEGDRVCAGIVEQRLERIEDEDIRVEEDRGGESSIEQVLEQVGLGGDRYLLS